MSTASLASFLRRHGTGRSGLGGNTSSGGSAQWGGYENGRIPANALCPVPSRPVLLLECNAAVAFDAMNTAFRAAFGQDIGITDGYRSFDEQVACRAEKGSLCADPGTSNHGWAKAVDIGACCGVNTGTGPAFDWLTANAATVRVGPPRVGAARRVETRTVALGIREHLMTWTPTDGTEAISSWLNQGVLFALVLAVATVIGCAVVWAVGSLAGERCGRRPGPGRDRGGARRRLAAGCRIRLSAVDLDHPGTSRSPATPSQYGIADTPDIPGAWQFLDLSERWTANINTVRAKDGLPPFRTDGALTERARTLRQQPSRAGW